MPFRGVFLAVALSAGLVGAAFYAHRERPRRDLARPTAALVRATGKCAECHRQETSAVVHEYEMSRHSPAGVTCLDCHQAAAGQETLAHRGFEITHKVTAANCRKCHESEYAEYLQSRHAAPAWAAVTGKKDFTPAQVAEFEKFHKGGVDREPLAITAAMGPNAVTAGCLRCHDVGKPNADGSLGSCTSCHARHAASVELARTPETCGQCHMGPDHSQIEIYHESKHGVLYNAQKSRIDLSYRTGQPASAANVTPVPTCATCHMSGLEGKKGTHNTSDRLSYYLFAAVSDRRPNYQRGRANMKAACLECHTNPQVLKFYGEAEQVVRSTNKLVKEADDLVKALRAEDLLTPAPFDEPIEYLHFELWHHDGRTAKHGAFMGGADFVQWHGYYEIESKLTRLKAAAADLRRAKKDKAPAPETRPGD